MYKYKFIYIEMFIAYRKYTKMVICMTIKKYDTKIVFKLS